MIPDNFSAAPRQSTFSQHLGTMYVPVDQKPGAPTVKLGLILQEIHGGGPGRGHGGITLTLLDEAMGRAASEASGALCVTASMTTHFCSGTKINTFICASAKVTKCSKNIVFVDGQLHDTDHRLLATASGIWVNTGQPIPASPKA